MKEQHCKSFCLSAIYLFLPLQFNRFICTCELALMTSAYVRVFLRPRETTRLCAKQSGEMSVSGRVPDSQHTFPRLVSNPPAGRETRVPHTSLSLRASL